MELNFCTQLILKIGAKPDLGFCGIFEFREEQFQDLNPWLFLIHQNKKFADLYKENYFKNKKD